MMAGKARLLAKVIENALTSDESEKQDSSLKDQYKAFQEILIHDIKPKEFADIYAQTIAYGMFAARLHDPTLDTFSRQEAAELIPKTNPFLRKLFQYIAGYDLDDRIRWIVDALADIFRATNVAALLKDFGKATQQNDPIIHFYETFLAEYDPKLRKSRGVWYTPEPVVNFIVRAVDDILKTEFNLPQGLADTSKTTIEVDTQIKDSRTVSGYKREKKDVYKVQILDPATGTGTFLAEVVKHIYKRFEGQQGVWSNYVEECLVPRLNGFELLMASYAMAHLKLDLLLTETGYKPKREQRFQVYLTNSLEEHHPDTGTLFASWLSNEASEANHIKRDTPVMVVLGNPPYSGHSANKGKWIEDLLTDYKQEPGGGRLKEKNSKWLNDDYVKFLRYGQQFVEKNGEGVLAFITNHGFLDNPTFRGMRWNLLQTFDNIYILDLHGNSKRKETCPDGSPDKNVFDIQQGVSINIFVKTGRKKSGQLAKVMQSDLFGSRESKYKFLWQNNLKSVPFVELKTLSPYYFFVKKDYEKEKKYDEGFSVNELFDLVLLGPNSHRDSFAISFGCEEAQTKLDNFKDSSISDAEISKKYDIRSNRDWKLEKARKSIPCDASPIKCIYRPFDYRYMLYGQYAFDYHRPALNDDLLEKNYAFIFTRQTKEDFSVFISNLPLGQHKIATPYDGSYASALYRYNKNNAQQSLGQSIGYSPNFNDTIVQKIVSKLGLKFSNVGASTPEIVAPIDLLDYVYAVLNSKIYREAYKELLKIDFPKVLYPKCQETFWKLVTLGKGLREMHLLESPNVEKFVTTYPQDGNNNITRKIGKKTFEVTDPPNNSGRVWINDAQYFDGVPEVAWNFYIGGYQPAQKWLKDREGRVLSFDDILHYQKTIVALIEADRIMQEIDNIDFM